MNDVFRAKIPNFIAALPIWNDTPMNDVYKAPKSLTKNVSYISDNA